MRPFVNILLVLILLSQAHHVFATDTWITVSAESVAKEFVKSKTWFSTKKMYSFSIVHASYDGWFTDTPSEQSKGYFYKKEDCFNSYILGTRTIQNGDGRVIIDSSQSTINITNKDTILMTFFGFEDYKSVLQNCRKVLKSKTRNVYRLELMHDTNPLKIVELGFTENGLTSFINMYFESESDDVAMPVLEKQKVSITILDYKPNPSISNNLFNTSGYVSFTKGKPVCTKSYQKFKLYDNRYKN
jgi:outer membrane lipoprotein-sorting protein